MSYTDLTLYRRLLRRTKPYWLHILAIFLYRGLRREEMSVQARIMAIADIFEALTASDRPYKKGKKLSECLKIMGRMKQDNHIDPDIFEIFIRDKVYLDYAEEFLDPEQIDEIDELLIPGYGSG